MRTLVRVRVEHSLGVHMLDAEDGLRHQSCPIRPRNPHIVANLIMSRRGLVLDQQANAVRAHSGRKGQVSTYLIQIGNSLLAL